MLNFIPVSFCFSLFLGLGLGFGLGLGSVIGLISKADVIIRRRVLRITRVVIRRSVT